MGMLKYIALIMLAAPPLFLISAIVYALFFGGSA